MVQPDFVNARMEGTIGFAMYRPSDTLLLHETP
jgi:hypothetical protein